MFALVRRLEFLKKLIKGKVFKKLLENNSFKYFGQERKIGHWTKVFKDIRIERGFFQKRRYQSSFE